MKSRHHELVGALTGQFDDHHGEPARTLLDQIDTLTRQIDQLTTRTDELIADIPAATAHHDDIGSPACGTTGLTVVQRLAEIPGLGPTGAHTILADIGLDMTRFPTTGPTTRPGPPTCANPTAVTVVFSGQLGAR